MITFEFFGVPRLRAGTGRLTLDEPAPSLGRALDGLGRACPALVGSVLQGQGRVAPAYRLCLNGDRFVSDPGTPLAEGDVLLVLAADVGG
jgi:molybdopterin converting factor small subunit